MTEEQTHDQWKGIEYLDIDQHNICATNFDKDVKAIQWRKDGLFKI